MMNDKDILAVERIQEEIGKIDKNENKIYFYVMDTMGTPSGSLSYIYKLALLLKEEGYNVAMLYHKGQEEFVGVSEWMGEVYASLPHYDISGEEVGVSPSDILFIPELFTNVMIQTKKLPCKRIAIMQNFDYLLEQMPVSSQWGDLGIMEAITNTDINSNVLKEVFPYVKTTTISPYVDNFFYKTKEPKKMIINIISKNGKDINSIIKPFYWKYPMYKWITFRHLSGFPQETFARMLQEAAMTIWVDDETTFGQSLIEAIQSGTLVMAKTCDNVPEWMEKDGILRNSCIWFNDFNSVHKMIASVIRAWITDSIPNEIENAANEVVSLFSKEKTKKQIVDYVNKVLNNRKIELNSMATAIKSKKETE